MSCVYLVVTRDVALPVWDVADSNPEHLQEMTALFFTSLLFGWFFFLMQSSQFLCSFIYFSLL